MSYEFPRFIVRLGELGMEGTARIPLAITGEWIKNGREFSITRDDLDDLIANFRKRLNGEVNVDYDHASEMPEVAGGGPIPSAGRIVNMDPPEVLGAGGSVLRKQPERPAPSTQPRFILYGLYEPTERARQLIRKREYRYVSPAIDWGARDKQTGKRQGTTLTSVALTNRPFLEELPEIRLSDPGFREVTRQETRNWKLDTSGRFPVSSFQFLGSEGATMKNLTLKNVDGAHQVFDGEEPVGVLAHDHLLSYAKEHVFEGGGKENASEAERVAKASRNSPGFIWGRR